MMRNVQLGVKRAADFLLAAAGIVLLTPLFFLIALAIRLESRGPIFFTQERVGLDGRIFTMKKFRTMVDRAAEMGDGFYTDQDDPRITRVGHLLRRISFDELPQLWNILVGNMSIIGPRPALPYHVELYTDWQKRRHLMRPGVTGWSQVNGRNSLAWPERIKKDIWYVENYSLWLDLKILWRTPVVWLKGEGIYASRENFFISGKDDIPMPPEVKTK